MTWKLRSLSLGLVCIISGCVSFPELEAAAPQDDSKAEFIEFLSYKALKDIPISSSQKKQLFTAGQLENMRRRADMLRNQNFTDN